MEDYTYHETFHDAALRELKELNIQVERTNDKINWLTKSVNEIRDDRTNLNAIIYVMREIKSMVAWVAALTAALFIAYMSVNQAWPWL